jgi:hypothetical protein
VLVSELGGFDMESYQDGGASDDEMLGCDVGAIKSGARGQLA